MNPVASDVLRRITDGGAAPMIDGRQGLVDGRPALIDGHPALINGHEPTIGFHQDWQAGGAAGGGGGAVGGVLDRGGFAGGGGGGLAGEGVIWKQSLRWMASLGSGMRRFIEECIPAIAVAGTHCMPDVGRTRKCISDPLKVANWVMAGIDGVIWIIALVQLIRICRHVQNGKWTRQKVFHTMVFAANLGYCIYFFVNPFASCSQWLCWSHACSFIALAIPQIIFLATFLLLLSF
ncbi:unnamed protein product, partial [Closterium sp. NIES-54]